MTFKKLFEEKKRKRKKKVGRKRTRLIFTRDRCYSKVLMY